MRYPARLAALTILAISFWLLVSDIHPIRAANSSAPASIIQVFPGKKAIKKALNKANPGDTLNLHAGLYNNRVIIAKANITLQSAGDGEVIIDAGCLYPAAIEMDSTGIVIKGLTVRGGSFYAINLVHQTSGEVRANFVESTCEGAEYGINVYNGGAIKVIKNQASGWEDAGVYIGGIASTGTGALMVKKNETWDSVRGVIIEDSDNVTIKVVGNNLHDNSETGILIHNSDGVLIRNNQVNNNSTHGIYLDAPSKDNRVIGNTFLGHTHDIRNEGTGNCFLNNTATNITGPTGPCL